MWIDRRRVLWTAAASATIGVLGSARGVAADDPLETVVQDVERRLKARVGVAVLDDHRGRAWYRRADERFALTGTFEALAGAALLARVDRGEERLDRSVVFAASDLVAWSPVTETRVGGAGMTLAEIAEAAITLSDDTAGNLLLKAIGGPDGLTRFVRSIGDDVTRLERRESGPNEVVPTDRRDTTTPSAMVHVLRELVLGKALAPSSRATLTAWMAADKVGGPLLRAGLPRSWRIADKTGADGRGARGVAAVVWPPDRAPLTVAVYVAETEAATAERDAAIAEIGAALARSLG